MDQSSRYRAAAGHLASALIGLASLFIGIRWIEAGGDPAAIPTTVIILSLVVLAPIAVGSHWKTRTAYVDDQVKKTCHFLTSVGLAGVLFIGIPAIASWLLPAGSEIWGRVTVIPYLGALVISAAWVYLSFRAAVLAARGAEDPYPRWTVSVI